MSGNCDSPRFLWMLILPMATLCFNKKPAVPFDSFDDITYFHRNRLVGALRETPSGRHFPLFPTLTRPVDQMLNRKVMGWRRVGSGRSALRDACCRLLRVTGIKLSVRAEALEARGCNAEATRCNRTGDSAWAPRYPRRGGWRSALRMGAQPCAPTRGNRRQDPLQGNGCPGGSMTGPAKQRVPR